jgi:hypothetical protein
MAVQIPRIDRGPAPTPQEQPGINVQVQDTSGIQRKIMDGTADVINNIGKVVRQKELDSYDTAARNAVNQYHVWHETNVQGDPKNNKPGLVHYDGEPSKVFNEFDGTDLKYREDLLKNMDLSDEGKGYVAQALRNKATTFKDNRLTAYGQLVSRYDAKVAETSIELEKQDAVENQAGFINHYDPASTVKFNSSLDTIKSIRLRHALKMGAAEEVPADSKDPDTILFMDETGRAKRVKTNNIVKQQIAKDISETISTSINSFIANRNLEEAEMMMKAYRNDIDPVNQAKLQEKYDTADIEAKAFNVLGKLDGASAVAQKQQLAKLPDSTAKQSEIKQKAYQLLDARTRMEANAQARDSKDIYDQLANQLVTMTDPLLTDSPIDNALMLEESEFTIDGRKVPFKSIVDRVTDSKQRKALYQFTKKRSEEGDPDAFLEFMNIAAEGRVYGMEFGDFAAMTDKMSKSEYDRAFNEWKMKNLETDADTRARGTWYNNIVTEELAAGNYGIIRTQSGTNNLTKDSAREVGAIKSKLSRDFSEILPKNISEKEAREHIKKYIAEHVKNKKDEDKKASFTERIFGDTPLFYSKKKGFELAEEVTGAEPERKRQKQRSNPLLNQTIKPKTAEEPEQKEDKKEKPPKSARKAIKDLSVGERRAFIAEVEKKLGRKPTLEEIKKEYYKGSN